MTTNPTLAPAEILGILNQADRQEKIRSFDTHAPLTAPEGLKHITPEELQLIALFRLNDERGQKLAFRLVTLHAVEYPRN